MRGAGEDFIRGPVARLPVAGKGKAFHTGNKEDGAAVGTEGLALSFQYPQRLHVAWQRAGISEQPVTWIPGQH